MENGVLCTEMVVLRCNTRHALSLSFIKGRFLSLWLLQNLFSCWFLITIPFPFCRGAGNLNIRMMERSSCHAVIFLADLVWLYGALCRPLISAQVVWPTPLGDKLKPIKDQDATSTPNTQRRTTMTIKPDIKTPLLAAFRELLVRSHAVQNSNWSLVFMWIEQKNSTKPEMELILCPLLWLTLKMQYHYI